MNFQRDWMFDPATGYLLEFTPEGAICKDTGFVRNLEEFENIKIVHRSDMKSICRRYRMKPFLEEETAETYKKSSLATTEERCPNCNRKGILFFTLQLRSADEGQTVFYECPDCGYKFSQET